MSDSRDGGLGIVSDFVNYNQRSVLLPKGCKDLMDIFDPPSGSASTSTMGFSILPALAAATLAKLRKETGHLPEKGAPQKMIRNESGTITGCDEIEAWLSALRVSKARVGNFSLEATSGGTLTLSFMRVFVNSQEHFHGALSIGRASAERTQEVDRILEAHGLKPRKRENFSLCHPDAPPEIHYYIEPVPQDAKAFARLVMDLHREVVGEGKPVMFRFTYREFA